MQYTALAACKGIKAMATMPEVAKRTGVSKTTVSHVLSGSSYVSQETKDRVFQAVGESGYRPNLLARNLSVKSTQALGLVVINTLYHGIYLSELLFHTTRMTEEKGWQLLLANGKHSAGEERRAIQCLLDLRCDATMVYPRFLSVDKVGDTVDAHNQPIMALSHRLRRNSSYSVWCNHKQTSFNAVAELINAGHQGIAFFTGSMDSPTGIEHLARRKDALTQHGIAFNGKLITNGKWTSASGAEGVEMLLKRRTKFSVLVTSNDDMVIGAMKALHEHDVAVPEQVSVTGLDDIAIASYIVSALPSVRTPVTEMIQEIIERLIFMLDDGNFSSPKTFSGKLIRRDSLITLSRQTLSLHVIVTNVDGIFFPVLQKLTSLDNSELRAGVICECIGVLTVIIGESDKPFHHC